jgi:hypothetical protein
MRRPTILQRIEALDPVADHERVVLLSKCHEFPVDTTRALEFALFRTYCVPSISGLLDRTGEFANRPRKRYDDTDIIVSELMEWGYSSDRGRAALRRMNQIHGRFSIANDDYLYVLSTFVFEPIRWIDRFGWRRLCEVERLAMFQFWREVGRRMNIKDIPENLSAFEQLNENYERTHFRYADSNRRVGEATRELFLEGIPRPFRPIARRVIHAMMDDPLIEAFGFPRPSAAERLIVRGALRLRAGVSRWLPRRRGPVLRTAMARPSYPQGYRIEEIGPPSERPE